MQKLAAVVVMAISVLFFSFSSFAATSDFSGAIQLRLKNSLPGKIDYYFTPQGGAPKLAGSLEAGASVDVKSQPGVVWLFAQDRKPFQKYTTREELFQQLIIAPMGQQKKPVVANAYQPPLKSASAATATTKKKPVADDTADQADSGKGSGDPSGMQWTFGAFEGGEGRVLQLTYGVPETDNVQVYATCVAANAGAANIIFGWDVNNQRPGKAARLRIVGEGFDRQFDASVFISESGEGVQGVELQIEASDKIWKQLKSVKSVRYNVGGQGGLKLVTAGLAAPLDKFLKQCVAIAEDVVGTGSQSDTSASNNDDSSGDDSGGDVASFDARTLFGGKVASGGGGRSGGGEGSCEALAKARSTNDGEQVSVVFENRSGEFRSINWIDPKGRPIQFGGINSGERFDAETFTSHPWMVTDGPGNCIEMFMPSVDQPVIKLTRKSPGFDPE